MGTPKRRPTAAASSSGDLLAFPRPSLAVDVAVMSVVPAHWLAPDAASDDRTLAVLLLRRTDGPGAGLWSLPGSFVRARERLDDAVLRTLADKCGLDGLAPRQLHVFDEPGRDDRGWVVSVAHVDVVPADSLARLLEDDRLTLAPIAPAPPDMQGRDAGSVRIVEPPGRQRWLPFDHDEIVTLAVDDLRERYRQVPDPARLVPEPFTLLELRRIHEAVLGAPLQKDTFRRQMAPHLRELDDLSDGTVGRPARLYGHLPAEGQD
jgi:ADP-ribose pyrophosphatase YjhB (NUDIX family)